jgi:hypothetical protein
MAPPPSPEHVSRAQAVRLGLELKALLRAEQTPDLEAFRLGKRVLYGRGNVDRLVERHRIHATSSRGLPTSFRSIRSNAPSRGRTSGIGADTDSAGERESPAPEAPSHSGCYSCLETRRNGGSADVNKL